MQLLKTVVIGVLLVNAGYSLISWISEPSQPEYVQPSNDYLAPASSGLDLSRLTGLVKKVRSGQELERKLNEKGGINNLDLNADNKVDYVRVEEFGSVEQKKIGYSLTTQPIKGETQEIAEVKIEQNKDNAEIQVVGNEQIYGANAIYNASTPIERKEEVAANRSYPVYNNYFYPHSFWVSPFYFGFYPSYFSFFPVVSRTTYINNTRSYNNSAVKSGRNSFQKQSNKSITNPNSNKIANKGIKRSLSKPTSTQKKFLARNRVKPVRSGGFGRNRSVSNSNSRTVKSGGYGRSGSVRSSSYRSRSYSSGGK